MKTIVLSAGHVPNIDPGAVVKTPSGILKEAEFVLQYRDALRKILSDTYGHRIVSVSDAYSLRETIKFSKTFKNDLCIELHFNCSDKTEANGMEVFYARGNKFTRTLSSRLCDEVCKALKLTNRGAKTDDASARGRIGFISDLENSILIEVAFLSCPEDLSKVHDVEKWGSIVAHIIDDHLKTYRVER